MLRYKPAIIFVIKFFAVYGLLTLLYSYYLSFFPEKIDPVSDFVVQLSNKSIQLFVPGVYLEYPEGYPRVNMMYEGYAYQYYIEGCSAISVMILFSSFVLSFKARAASYVWFVPAGIVVILVTNVLRITLIGLCYLYYPQTAAFLHDFAFPAVIYGVTMLLWVVWVKYFIR